MSSLAARIWPPWRPGFAVGVYAITAVCGLLDAATFLGLGLVFVETMTANVLLLAFSVGAHGTRGRFASVFPGGTVVPYVAALAAFTVGAVVGGRLVRAGELGRRVGFAVDSSLIGIAAVAVVLTHPGPANDARYPVIMILACAAGIQNALVRHWGVRDLATNLVTLTFTGLFADSTLGGGSNPRAERRSVSLVVLAASAAAGAFLTRYGVLWPLLTAFTLFVVALPILLQPRSEPNTPEQARLPGGEPPQAVTACRPAMPTVKDPRFPGFAPRRADLR